METATTVPEAITSGPRLGVITDVEIDSRFTFRKLRPGQGPRYDAIWAGARAYAYSLRELCPASPELIRALDSLDHVVWEANAAVARHYETGSTR